MDRYLEQKDMSHDELRRLHDEVRTTSKYRQGVHARRKLSSLLNKKFKTTMIGALASFESNFGHLWGHGKSIESLSKQEEEWRYLWEETRTDILNKGNCQIRASQEEMNNYDLQFKGYQTELMVTKPRTTGE